MTNLIPPGGVVGAGGAAGVKFWTLPPKSGPTPIGVANICTVPVTCDIRGILIRKKTQPLIFSKNALSNDYKLILPDR